MITSILQRVIGRHKRGFLHVCCQQAATAYRRFGDDMSTAVFVADQEKSARKQAAGRLTFNHSTDVHQHVINGTSMFQIKHGSACMTQRLTGVHACSRAEWSQVGTEVSYNRVPLWSAAQGPAGPVPGGLPQPGPACRS